MIKYLLILITYLNWKGGYSDYSSKDFENPDYEYIDQVKIVHNTLQANNVKLGSLNKNLNYEYIDQVGLFTILKKKKIEQKPQLRVH